jgi:hypothetical protein
VVVTIASIMIVVAVAMGRMTVALVAVGMVLGMAMGRVPAIGVTHGAGGYGPGSTSSRARSKTTPPGPSARGLEVEVVLMGRPRRVRSGSRGPMSVCNLPSRTGQL